MTAINEQGPDKAKLPKRCQKCLNGNIEVFQNCVWAYLCAEIGPISERMEEDSQ